MSKVETAIASFHGEEFKFYFPNKECVQYNQMKESGKFCEENLLQKIWSMGLGGAYLDIGGNIGNHAIFFANFCDCDRVVTFEPTPRFIRCLEMNVDVNNMKDKIQIVKAAVSNHEGRGRMKNGGGGEENEILIAGDSVDVVKLRADNFAYEVGLIKVDTEGTELNALKGCETIIQRDSPVIVAGGVSGSSSGGMAMISPLGSSPQSSSPFS